MTPRAAKQLLTAAFGLVSTASLFAGPNVGVIGALLFALAIWALIAAERDIRHEQREA